MECANCKKEIGKNEMYYQCKDNFLLVKYFDNEQQSIFCSTDCFCEWCSLDLEFNEKIKDA